MKATELYALNSEWSENYSKYLSMISGSVNKISNAPIVEEMNRNERKLEENVDYVLVNKLVWQVISKLY